MKLKLIVFASHSSFLFGHVFNQRHFPGSEKHGEQEDPGNTNREHPFGQNCRL